MSTGRRAFTLIELLVVVAIIAVLIAILLPSLGRAREKAKVVKCQANLHNLYQAVTLYATENDDAFLPCVLQSGSQTDYAWCGDNQLGPIFGYRRLSSGASQLTIRGQIAKMLDCPSIQKPPIDPLLVVSTTPFEFDYTYNENLGECVVGAGVIPNSDPNPASGAPGFKINKATGSPTPNGNMCSFTRRSNVRRETLVSIDLREFGDKNDYHFLSVDVLVPAAQDNVSGKGEAGIPHAKKANMLFADGQIILDDPNKLLNNGGTKMEWIPNFRIEKGTPFPF